MKLDYGTQISSVPILLSIGTLKKPTLQKIAEIGFDKFMVFESFAKLTPKLFYTKLQDTKGGKERWATMSEQEKLENSLYHIICENDGLQSMYVALFSFFFEENIRFHEGYFILYKGEGDILLEENQKNICGVIHEKIFEEILGIIQQICGIYDDTYDISDMKFPSEFAKRKYLEFLEAKREAEEKNNKKDTDKNMSIPNIISAVANKHPSLNYNNIWDLTIFQLLDAFHRLQANTAYDIDSTRVSVWGDEKKTFDFSLWYKNEYDKS